MKDTSITIIQKLIDEHRSEQLEHYMLYIDMKYILSSCKLNSWFINKYHKYHIFDWSIVSRNNHNTDELIIEILDNIPLIYFEGLISNNNLSEKIVIKLISIFHRKTDYNNTKQLWKIAATTRNLSNEFIRDFIPYLQPNLLMAYQSMSDETMEFITNYTFGNLRINDIDLLTVSSKELSLAKKNFKKLIF